MTDTPVRAESQQRTSAQPDTPAQSSPAASTEAAGADAPGGPATRTGSRYDDLPVAPARYLFRWFATAIVLVLLAMVASSLITNDRWEWSIVGEYLTYESVIRGLQGTLLLTASATVVGFGLGTVLALMRLSSSPLLQSVAWGYVWVFRSVPVLLQLLLWYNLAYLYPTLSLGIPFGPEFVEFGTLDVIGKFGAAVLGLGLSQAAYSSEIVRAGILSVDQGQHEAAASLGIPRGRQQRRIVLPQAMRTIVPTSVNEIIGLAKGTSVVFVLAYSDLFYTVQVIYGRNQRVLPLLLVAAIWYVLITTVLTIVQYYLERHYAKGALRTLPPTPLQRLRWTAAIWASRISGRPVPDWVPASFAAGRRPRTGTTTRNGDAR